MTRLKRRIPVSENEATCRRSLRLAIRRGHVQLIALAVVGIVLERFAPRLETMEEGTAEGS